MGKGIVLVVFAAVVLGLQACSGGGGTSESDSDAGGEIDADVPPMIDAGAPDASPVSCNPKYQSPCETDEKCSQREDPNGSGLLGPVCMPDGSVDEGGNCSYDAGGSDNCVAGTRCLFGRCALYCGNGPCSGSCQSFQNPDGGDPIGVCLRACTPTDDSTAGGLVTNAECGAPTGCYINAGPGTAICTLVTVDSATQTQNELCNGSAGSCYLNGCASGFSPWLREGPTAQSTTYACSRYCTPANSYMEAQGAILGVASKCSTDSLAALGGANGNASEHQCRFAETYAGDGESTNPLDAGIGMCVPVVAADGDSWGDCRLLDWVGIQAVWNGALDAGDSPQAAFDAFCVDGSTSETRPKCLGLYYGCIGLAEKEAGLPGF
jgi:hypothetical protein